MGVCGCKWCSFQLLAVLPDPKTTQGAIKEVKEVKEVTVTGTKLNNTNSTANTADHGCMCREQHTEMSANVQSVRLHNITLKNTFPECNDVLWSSKFANWKQVCSVPEVNGIINEQHIES